MNERISRYAQLLHMLWTQSGGTSDAVLWHHAAAIFAGRLAALADVPLDVTLELARNSYLQAQTKLATPHPPQSGANLPS